MRSLILTSLLLLTACAGLDTEDVPPENKYTIDVVRQPDGSFKAMAPACKEWDEDLISRTNNDAFPQLGCATRSNLANQIAYPEDLVRDQWAVQPAYPGGDGATLATGVQRYQENRTYEPESNLTSASE